ncbi:MAG: hypothetical protein OEV55_00210 [candidate division Zixibacteria bacterium]|nr:hypothetical protein [candidate division Zixibacteria bacterium]
MKSKLVSIKGKLIGIVGVEEIFAELFEAGKKPDKDLENYLLDRLKEHNYIPQAAEKSYAKAFLQEYQKFCISKSPSGKKSAKKLKTWQGIPREEIPWFPTIMEELCDGCKACSTFCSFGVYEYVEETNKVKVANPFNCEVGCSTCALKCKPKAIVFPPLEILKAFRKGCC